MIEIPFQDNCCGCTACACICPRAAITMEPDALGFLYPKVDGFKCIECGLCEKICQFNDNYDRSLNFTTPIAYAGRHHDLSEVMKSRSGAAFVAISNYILDNGGVVYGAGYKDHFRVAHKRAATKEERDELRGSKYVQSDLTGVFRAVKEDLKSGLTVLFSGTPCQTAGLHAFVGKRLRENLLLIDIACHGVPAPFIWRDYIAYLEKKHKSPIINLNFRDKEAYGWAAHKETFIFDRIKEKKTFNFRFYQNLFFRPSCSNCHFTNFQRPSDITLADFWGWQKTSLILNKDNRGVSLVLCNTNSGLHIFNKVKHFMDLTQVELANATQRAFVKPIDKPRGKDMFFFQYEKYGFERTMKKFGLMGWKYEVKSLVATAKNKYHRIFKILI